MIPRAADAPTNFYPRPLRGGRRALTLGNLAVHIFLSTPSARRATLDALNSAEKNQFLSTPSARRATRARSAAHVACVISIHALCEEGDRNPRR